MVGRRVHLSRRTCRPKMQLSLRHLRHSVNVCVFSEVFWPQKGWPTLVRGTIVRIAVVAALYIPSHLPGLRTQ